MDAATIGWIVTGIGFIITAVGWLVSNRQANTRETRKEYRTALTSLESTLDRFLEAYLSYGATVDAEQKERARLRVHAEIGRVRRQTEWLAPKIGCELSQLFGSFYELATGGDFESVKRISADRYSHVVTAGELMLECCEDWFRKTYH